MGRQAIFKNVGRNVIRGSVVASLLIGGISWLGTGTAWAWGTGLQPSISVGAVTSPVCTTGSAVWTVDLTVTVQNIETGDPAYVTAVTYTSSPSGPVTVVDSGGLASGTVVPAGKSTTTYHPVLDITLPSNTTSASVSVDIAANWGTADPKTYDYTATSSIFTLTCAESPAITLTKTASITSFSAVGTPVTYFYKVKNTGDVTLDPVNVTDPMMGLSAISCPHTSLTVGEVETCTATYTTTQADVSAGSIKNTGTATGYPPVGPPVKATSSVSIPYVPPVVQTIAGNIYECVNGAVSTTLASATGAALSAPTTPPVTGTNTIPATDVAAGTFTMSATAPTGDVFVACGVATPPTIAGGGLSATQPVIVPSGGAGVGNFYVVTDAPAITVLKSSTTTSVDVVGQVVPYDFLVTNIGNVTLTDVTVTDTPVLTTGPTCPESTLAPGASETCTGTWTVTQANLTAGHVTDTAIATGTPPVGPPVNSPPSTVIIPVVQTIAGNIYECVNGAVSTTLASATGAALSAPTTPPVTGTNTIPATDVAAGTFTMSATAPTGDVFVACGVATPPTIAGGGLSATQPVIVPSGGAGVGNFYVVTDAPAITVLKSSTTTSVDVVGQVVPYDFLVTNIGNVTLTDVTVTDTPVLTTGPTCPESTLAPGASETCTGTWTVTQANLTAGHVTDTAIATGTPPVGPPVNSPPSTVTIPVTQTKAGASPGISLTKSASVTTYSAAGTVVTYYYKVTNTGNVLLDPVAVSDPMPGLSAISCPDTSLTPGEVETCTATYTTTSAAVTAGSIKNTGTATGLPPTGPAVTATSSLTIPYLATGPAVSPTATTPSGHLAFTGAPLTRLVEAAMLLMLLGFGLLSIERGYRRRRI